MRKFLGLLAALAVVFLAPPANAESWYAGLFGGLNSTHDGNTGGGGVALYDLGFAAGGYAGVNIKQNVRVEGELSYRANGLDSVGGAAAVGDVETLAIMANAYFDFGRQSGFKPYIGGGLGFADVDFIIGGNKYNATELAVQFIGGAGMELSPDLLLTLEYRAFMTDDLSIGGGSGLGAVEYFNSAIAVGLRKNF